jgi:hypothetical protein
VNENNGEDMKIQGFIFNWKGHEQNALALQQKVSKFIDVTVINSEEQLSGDHPGWVHLDDNAYFSAQWNKAKELFNGDVMFHMQADAEFDQFEELFIRARWFFDKFKIGVYEPNVDYTKHRYHVSKLDLVETDLYNIPVADCTCWFVAGELVRTFPVIDLSLNKYGWGVSRVISALCPLQGRLCVRDYRFLIRHPKHTGYPVGNSLAEFMPYAETLGAAVQQQMMRNEQSRTKVLWAVS